MKIKPEKKGEGVICALVAERWKISLYHTSESPRGTERGWPARLDHLQPATEPHGCGAPFLASFSPQREGTG